MPTLSDGTIVKIKAPSGAVQSIKVVQGPQGVPGDSGTGGGAVDSVNGHVGAVVLAASDVGADPAGTAATAVSGEATARAGADTALDGRLDTLEGQAAAFGDVVTHDAADFDAAGAASTAQAAAVAAAASDATTKANAAQAYAIDRAHHTGTQSADTLTDGTTNKAFLATERTKLAGIATGATANSPDATLLARANHTGTQTSATISDFAEAAQDAVAAALAGTTGATVTYDDAANTITITGIGDPETMRDTIGAALVGVGNITVTVDDAGNTITISTTATVNSTDAALRDRSTHTGTQTASTVSDFSSAADARIAAAVGVSVQALDSDLTAIAALTTTTFGRALLALADAAALRTAAGLGTAATQASTAFDAAGAAAAAQAASQPVDSDLTAIAALTTTTFGRALLALADAAALRTAAGLGTAAVANTGTGAGNVILGNDARLTDARTPTAHKATHATGGSDALAPSDIGAVPTTRTLAGLDLSADRTAAAIKTALAIAKADITDLGTIGTAAAKNTGTASGDVPLLSTGGVLPIARLATGTPDGTKFIRDDGTLVTPSGGGTLPSGTQGQALAYGAAGTLAAVTPPWGGGDYFRSGYYSHGMFISVAAGTLACTLSRLYARPFYVPVRRAFDRIGLNVSTAATAASGGVLRMGIYGPGGGVPGPLIVDAGTISSESTGAKELTIAQTLDPGVYWIAVVAQVATCTVTSYATAIETPWVSNNTNPGGSLNAASHAMNSVTGALGTFTPSGANNQMIAVQLRAA